ncbi:MAG: CarboxypepD reg-like domain [Bacteroidetes bacterium]|jgi:hypothetical protein|nr:CarboxypepD reg-like domain [Bacteroidota bacterium]
MKVNQHNKVVSMLSVFVFCFVLAMNAKADGVGDKPNVEDPSPAPKLLVGKIISSSKAKKYVFRGSITDIQTNLPVKGARITMKGTSVGVVTDAYGLYLFSIPESLVKDNMFFEINYPGYERKSFFIDKDLLPIVDQGIEGHIKRIMLK